MAHAIHMAAHAACPWAVTWDDHEVQNDYAGATGRGDPSAFEALRRVPMLLVRGALSDLLSEETVWQMGTRNPAMRTITVPQVGHAPTLDEPEVRQAIHALLDGIA